MRNKGTGNCNIACPVLLHLGAMRQAAGLDDPGEFPSFYEICSFKGTRKASVKPLTSYWSSYSLDVFCSLLCNETELGDMGGFPTKTHVLSWTGLAQLHPPSTWVLGRMDSPGDGCWGGSRGRTK